MRRILCSLLLGLTLSSPTYASLAEELAKNLESLLKKEEAFKLPRNFIMEMAQQPVDVLCEAFFNASDAATQRNMPLLEKYVGKVFNGLKIPDGFRSTIITYSEIIDGQEFVQNYNIKIGSPGRAELKERLLAKKLPPSYYIKMYLFQVEVAGFLALVTSLFDEPSHLELELEEVEECNRKLASSAAKVMEQREKVVKTFLRPIFIKQFDGWDVSFSNEELKAKGTLAMGIAPAFQDVSVLKEADLKWYHITNNFLKMKQSLVVDFCDMLTNPARQPLFIKKLSTLIKDLEVKHSPVILMTSQPQGRKSNPRLEASKEHARRRLLRSREISPVAEKPPEQKKADAKPKEFLGFVVEDLGVAELLRTLDDSGEGLVGAQPKETLVAQVARVLRACAKAKQELVQAVFALRGMNLELAEGNPFVVFFSNSHAETKDINLDPNSTNEPLADGLLMRSKNDELESKLQGCLENDGIDSLQMLYLRERAIEDIFVMQLVTKLMPHVLGLKTQKIILGTATEAAVRSYNALCAKFVYCYQPVFLDFIIQSHFVNMGNRILDARVMWGRLSIHLDNFGLETRPTVGSVPMNTFLQIVNGVLTAATEPHFPAVFDSASEQREFRVKNGSIRLSQLMPLATIRAIQANEAKLQEVNRQLMEKLKLASDMNLQNEAVLKNDEKVIEQAKAEVEATKKSLKDAFDLAVKETRETAAREKTKLVENHRKQMKQNEKKAAQDLRALEEKHSIAIEELKAKKADIEAEREKAQQRVVECEQSIAHLKSQLQQIKDASALKEKELSLALQGNMSLKDSLDQSEEAQDQLRKQLAEAELRLSAAKTQAAQLKEKNTELAKKILTRAEEFNALKKEKEEREQDNQLAMQKQIIAVTQLESQVQELESGQEALKSENARLLAELEALRQAAAQRPAVEESTMDKDAVRKLAKAKAQLIEKDATIASLNSMRKMYEEKLAASEVERLQEVIRGLSENPEANLKGTWVLKNDKEEDIQLNLPQVLLVATMAVKGGMLGEPGVMDEIERRK